MFENKFFTTMTIGYSYIFPAKFGKKIILTDAYLALSCYLAK